MECSYSIVLLTFIHIGISGSSKILMSPFPFYSHIRELTHIGDGLVEKGHDLHLVLPRSLPQIQEFRDDKSFTLVENKVKYKDFHMLVEETDYMEGWLESIIKMSLVQDFRENVEGFTEICLNVLEDEQLYERLKAERYDLAIVDAFPCSRCFMILLYNLDIPYVSVTTQYEPWLSRTPALPSFVPFGMMRPPYTDSMTFWQRLNNAYHMIDWVVKPGVPYLDDDLVAKYATKNPHVTLNWLAGRSLLWLMDTDISLEFARPSMANEVNIGGLSTKPAKPLPDDLKSFMDNSPDGVILASFGSLSSLPLKYTDIFLETFKKVKQKVIFRYVYEVPKDLPAHIKLLKWIPQNDILAHANIKLFITHCGANSQFEALYHAVPMLNVPIFAEQPYNAKRGDNRGYSRTVELATLTSEELLHNINAVIGNSSYKENVMRGSRMFKDQRMDPRERAVYWVEHVLKFGGDHLHSHALDMPWYEYIMLDILAVLLTAFIMLSFMLYFLARFMIKFSCRVLQKNEKAKRS